VELIDPIRPIRKQLGGICAVKQAGSVKNKQEHLPSTCRVVNGSPGSALVMGNLIEEDKQ
jgi:hypothetical protein